MLVSHAHKPKAVPLQPTQAPRVALCTVRTEGFKD